MDLIQETIDLGAHPLTLWGSPSDRLLVTVHGKRSRHDDADITVARDHALGRGEQVLTWDLPGHGARPGTPADCRITDAARELDQIWTWAVDNFAHRRVFATSMGAYLTLVTAPQPRLDEAWFLSPLVDMAGLVQGLMDAFSVTPELLRETGRVETPVEPLEWSQYEFIATHPVTSWTVPTRILRGADDEVVAASSVADFCRRTGAEMTIAANSAHYFHTDADMQALLTWLARPDRSW